MASSRVRQSHEMPEDVWMVDSRRVSSVTSSTSWNRCWRGPRGIKGTLNQACQGLCTKVLWLTPQFQLLQIEQVYTNTQAHAQTPPTQTHRPPSKEPESGDNNGWRLDDTRQPRTPTSQIHSKHGRALFAQAWQRPLQGTSETDETVFPPEPPPPGSTYSCYICRGVDIRRTCDPPAGDGTETDIPTAKRSPWSPDRNDAGG